MTPIEWEIWLVDMPFEEGIGSKIRPGLVIGTGDKYYIVGKMTSHSPRENYPYEYPLQDWKAAGLSVPTTLRLSQIMELDISTFKKKIGTIQSIDMIEILRILNTIAKAREK